MKKLLSLPPNLVESFHSLSPEYNSGEWFCTSDPADCKLGSGGGTAWLMDSWEKSESHGNATGEKKIIIHAGGQSRRLPAYASVGKVLAPIPAMRWALGQHIDQNLLSLQLPLYEQILEAAPAPLNTLIASGDVCIRQNGALPDIPQADVVCFGLWAEAHLASHHGVFASRRESPDILDCMLQKPSVDQLNHLTDTHFYLMDIGLWLLSDKALKRLRDMSHDNLGRYRFYDMYSDFGCALGVNPSKPDSNLSDLTVAIVPLTDGEFYHFGTTRELISSTLALQSVVTDQRRLMHHTSKPTPALFVQNCTMGTRLTDSNHNVWVENSHIGQRWTMTDNHAITGVPVNDWPLNLTPGACIDITPVGERAMAVRPYGFDDPMRGDIYAPGTVFMGISMQQWMAERNLDGIIPSADIQSAKLFPLVEDIEQAGLVARWMISEPWLSEGRQVWMQTEKISADDISALANLPRLYSQRDEFMKKSIAALADNYERSIFYQLDLDHLAKVMLRFGIDAPAPLGEYAECTTRMRNLMLQNRIDELKSGSNGCSAGETALKILREEIVHTIDTSRTTPKVDVHDDQIVWGRSPVRIDLAGGWTDTPPYSIQNGGSVVNMAIELNGLPPLQVFVKPTKEHHIILRSIDLGATETVDSYESLLAFNRVGSPFSIPKAALALAGFAPDFCGEHYRSLREQLQAIGSGIELTLLSAVPAGSGLGTSSILASTVLGALSDFCGLAWDKEMICSRTLALEQLLTTGGGWQDQYGGVLQGIKMLRTDPGWKQQPIVNWLPDGIITAPEYASCHMLYYTGITRTAKGILADIVKRMFLNESGTLQLLERMRRHTSDVAEAIQRRDFTRYGTLIGTTWEQNKKLDSGTNPPAIQAIINRVADYTLGLKLPGAGGGGFLYMVAKDPDAAIRIRRALSENPLNANARFVDMRVSEHGLQISRS